MEEKDFVRTTNCIHLLQVSHGTDETGTPCNCFWKWEHGCELHRKCTTGYPRESLPCCQSCPDYDPDSPVGPTEYVHPDDAFLTEEEGKFIYSVARNKKEATVVFPARIKTLPPFLDCSAVMAVAQAVTDVVYVPSSIEDVIWPLAAHMGLLSKISFVDTVSAYSMYKVDVVVCSRGLLPANISPHTLVIADVQQNLIRIAGPVGHWSVYGGNNAT